MLTSTPDALRELIARAFDADCQAILDLPQTSTRLRPYQLGANAAVEKAIAERKRHMLVAMATGTGKTFTMVNQVYRLMKSGLARRVLFLVDRRALRARAQADLVLAKELANELEVLRGRGRAKRDGRDYRACSTR